MSMTTAAAEMPTPRASAGAMQSESASAAAGAVRRWAHPGASVLLIAALAAGTVVLLVLGGPQPEVLAWVVVALSAGYAVSGSV